MQIRLFLAAAAAAFALSPALAHDDSAHDDGTVEHPEGVIHIHDAYARTTASGSGAVYFTIHNNTDADDRLVAARSEVAEKVELHTNIEGDDGVMKMVALPDGIELIAGDMHALARGGDHVMLMGLTRKLEDGDHFPLTLVFSHWPEITVDVVVDNERAAGDGGMDEMDHSAHDDHSAHGDGHSENGDDHSSHGD